LSISDNQSRNRQICKIQTTTTAAVTTTTATTFIHSFIFV